MLDAYKDLLDYRILGAALTDLDNVELMKYIMPNLTQDTKDYLLSKSSSNQNNINLALINAKSLFNTKYFNRDTSTKINNILDQVMNREEE